MKLAYVDACVWITRIEGLSSYKIAIEAGLREFAQDGWTFCVSDAVRLEVLIGPLRKGQDELGRIYRDLFARARNLRTHMQVFKDALSVAHTENLKGMDAVHMAIALRHGCRQFVTTDPHFRQPKPIVPHWIDLGSGP